MAQEKKQLSLSNVSSDAGSYLVSSPSPRVGMLLMIVNRLVGLVLPASSKYLIDDVIIKHRSELLLPLALAAGGANSGPGSEFVRLRRCSVLQHNAQ